MKPYKITEIIDSQIENENIKTIYTYLLLYLLNLDIVQKQIQAITFVQGTILQLEIELWKLNYQSHLILIKEKKFQIILKK